MNQRENGIFYTTGNPFNTKGFKEWASSAKIAETQILEPFAGANSLIENLKSMELCKKWKSFDIHPGADGVEKKDTLLDFPQGFQVCVTNPPWLAKNSATRRGLPFPKTQYDDLYKLALDKCLANCDWVAALVPESFIRANIFRERLQHFISLPKKMFNDTENPVGLALFQPVYSSEIIIWRGNKRLGMLSKLERKIPPKPCEPDIVRFNEPNGNVGLIAIDNHHEASIRFCHVDELRGYPISNSCRSKTKLLVDSKLQIERWNDWLTSFRKTTHDVFLTCFKGVRKDGMYRRRLDWNLARRIVIHLID